MRLSHLADAGRALAVAAGIGVLVTAGCTGSSTSNPDSAQETTGYMERTGESWAEHYGITDPPDVQPIRFIGSEEVDIVHRRCLIEAGYQRNDVGLISVPEGQESAFALAEYTCRMQYPVREEYTQEWGDEQLRIQYQWTVDFVIPCLEAEGHPIGDPPSRTVFVESWESDPYLPFSQVRLSASTEHFNEAWAALEARCPQIAPGEVLWDGVSIEDWAARRG